MSRDTREVCPATSHGTGAADFAPDRANEAAAVGPF
jgi:hypothetical protein